jgi:hypothetical protein
VRKLEARLTKGGGEEAAVTSEEAAGQAFEMVERSHEFH